MSDDEASLSDEACARPHPERDPRDDDEEWDPSQPDSQAAPAIAVDSGEGDPIDSDDAPDSEGVEDDDTWREGVFIRFGTLPHHEARGTP